MSSKTLKILSWNIQSRNGINGNKLNDQSFVNLITKCDIFCLQECRKDIKIPNFICFNKQRQNSSGGGVTLGFSRRLAGGVRRYNTGNKVDLLAVVLDKTFFKCQKDILLVTSYIPPNNSSYIKDAT